MTDPETPIVDAVPVTPPCRPDDVTDPWGAARYDHEVSRMGFRAIARRLWPIHPELSATVLRERARAEGWNPRHLGWKPAVTPPAPAAATTTAQASAQVAVEVEVSQPHVPVGTPTAEDDAFAADVADDCRKARSLARSLLTIVTSNVRDLEAVRTRMRKDRGDGEPTLLVCEATIGNAHEIAKTLEKIVAIVGHVRTTYARARRLEAPAGPATFRANIGAQAFAEADDEDDPESLARDLACLPPDQLEAALVKVPEATQERIRALLAGGKGAEPDA